MLNVKQLYQKRFYQQNHSDVEGDTLLEACELYNDEDMLINDVPLTVFNIHEVVVL